MGGQDLVIITDPEDRTLVQSRQAFRGGGVRVELGSIVLHLPVIARWRDAVVQKGPDLSLVISRLEQTANQFARFGGARAVQVPGFAPGHGVYIQGEKGGGGGRDRG